MDQQTPAPGWYPDPATPGQRRYWDGQGWTNSTAPGPQHPAAPGVQPGVSSGVAWQPGPASPSPGVPTNGTGPSGWAGGAAGTSDAYYQRAYAQFDAGGSKVVWNWAAFLFGAIWYLFRGMWAKALLLVALLIFTGGLLAIPVWIYGGLMGTYDDYLLRRRGTQGW